MNILDRFILALAPVWGVSRIRARRTANILNAYEAGNQNRFRKQRGDAQSGDTVAANSTEDIRQLARDLDQNHDIARGILNTMVNSVVGTEIMPEPMVRDENGELVLEVNEQIQELYQDWSLFPEVTKELDNGALQRLACRSWLRDGECFTQLVEGNVARLNHDTVVPFSIELIEADLVPVGYTDEGKGIRNGIQRNNWGQATNYFVYKDHPGDLSLIRILQTDTKRIPAEKMLHLKLADRIRQGRGVSVFASVFTRLDDLRDYEEAERIAARIASAQVMAITKSQDVVQNIDDDSDSARSFSVSPGTVWDNLLPGEKPEILSSDRPDNKLESWRSGQLKAAAAGTGSGYSSISKDYNGTYSAQRQELVEQSIHYNVLRQLFIAQFVRPVYRRFIRAANMAGKLNLPDGIDENTLFDAEFRGPTIPWIDPKKEMEAEILAVDNKLKSRSQAIRDRGGIPQKVAKQITQDETLFGKVEKQPPPPKENNNEDEAAPAAFFNGGKNG